MGKKLFGMLLALAVAAGCAGCGIVSSPDGPTALIGPSGTLGQDGSGYVHHEDDHIEDGHNYSHGDYHGDYTDNYADDYPDGYADNAPSDGDGYTEPEGYSSEAAIDEDGSYNSVEDVSLYLDTYGHLPSNYITKSEARELGWTGGSVEDYAPGCAIGGDYFGNREGVLPAGDYHECDIDTVGQSSRGAKRIVWSDDGRIYYTDDHYESFTLLYGEETE